MKHQFVDETLLTSERIAPFAVLSHPDDDPLPQPTRVGLVWEGDACVEVGIAEMLAAAACRDSQEGSARPTIADCRLPSAGITV